MLVAPFVPRASFSSIAFLGVFFEAFLGRLPGSCGEKAKIDPADHPGFSHFAWRAGTHQPPGVQVRRRHKLGVQCCRPPPVQKVVCNAAPWYPPGELACCERLTS